MNRTSAHRPSRGDRTCTRPRRLPRRARGARSPTEPQRAARANAAMAPPPRICCLPVLMVAPFDGAFRESDAGGPLGVGSSRLAPRRSCCPRRWRRLCVRRHQLLGRSPPKVARSADLREPSHPFSFRRSPKRGEGDRNPTCRLAQPVLLRTSAAMSGDLGRLPLIVARGLEDDV